MRELRDPHLDVLLGIEHGAKASLALVPGRSVDIPQPLEIPQVEQADSHVWVRFAQETELSILPGDEPLPHRRQLEIQVVLREKEIRGNELDRSPIPPPPDRECRRFIGPPQSIEGQESRQLDFGRMSKPVVIRLEQPTQWREELLARRFIEVEREAPRFLRFIGALIDFAQALKSGCPGHGLPAPRAITRLVARRRREGR
jgi:hypothetical protein